MLLSRSAVARATAIAALLVLGPALSVSAARPVPAAKRPNVLFIAVDDLNHWVRHLGRNRQVITPNIDRLAARGVTFTRAYAPAPVCNPSRVALLSGLRPSTTGIYDNEHDHRPVIAEESTLLSHFRRSGYYVAGAGKIYHGGRNRRSEWDDYFGGGGDPRPMGNRGVGPIRFAPLDAPEERMADHRVTDWVIDQLGRKHDRPFFLAAGLHKPHLPWNVPRKYFDMYPLESVRLPPTKKGDLQDVPAAGKRMARAQGDHERIVASLRWREAVRGYLAAITYTDANVGRLLDALDRSPHKANTIVVLWGDHGWHLGEKQHWRKFALWEEATRAPFIWVVPGVTKPGGVSPRPVDFMSVYPTLSELCGLPVPKHVEGVSIRPLLASPKAAWSKPAVMTYGRENHAVRTEAWRYIRYRGGGEELYDEARDPYEWTNLADRADLAAERERLAGFFPKVNAPALPSSPTTDD